jgi:NitT/TauT family transport system substrate-binding protein
MKRLISIAAAIMLMLGSAASAKEKITYGYLIDPVLECFLYAIHTGKVTSDLIDVETTPMSVPAGIQATATKQYDVILSATIAIPLAASKGLELKALSVGTRYGADSHGGDVWVRKDSPYKTIADLKGKTIAVSSLNSTGTTWVRIGLWKKYGVNVHYDGGDFQWVQIPAGSEPAALSTGKVDAAVLIHSQAILALKTGEYRSIAQTAKLNYELFGVPEVAGINVSYPEKLAARPAAFKEFNRMLKASHDYALAHIDEVSQAVAAKGKMPAGFFKDWITQVGESPATIDDLDIKSMDVLWAASKELGILKSYPAARSVVWDESLKMK